MASPRRMSTTWWPRGMSGSSNCSTGWPSDSSPREEPCRTHAQVPGFATTPDTVLKVLS
ncbi:unnamed protein product [Gulo gulo]|uniref:Uncharacterized protein n=1 Tax=Gulo gulo TaxID=48420 RepID=A0A9X9LH35_GULGU|nr:unnamed protein product [Gulo gulo]